MLAFDLDGTITRHELLPIIAMELSLEEEMSKLTRLTMDGEISFQESFRHRVDMLKDIPVSKVQDIVSNVEIDEHIEYFIRANAENCAIVTGNLDVWIKPITDKLGCRLYSSKAIEKNGALVGIKHILSKDEAIRDLRKNYDKIVAIGESYNDLPMFKESDIGIAYGGVHNPIKELICNSKFVVYRGDVLCSLLNTLL